MLLQISQFKMMNTRAEALLAGCILALFVGESTEVFDVSSLTGHSLLL